MSKEGKHYLAPLISGWIGALKRAENTKKEFQANADECMNFFCKNSEWLWSKHNKRRFFNGSVEPKFMMTLNKAFEMVALFGPLLYHDNPVRTVTPRKHMELDLNLLVQPVDPNMLQMGDQMAMQQQQQNQMLLQQASMQQSRSESEDATRAELLSAYLNYTPNEMPGGGLKLHAWKAITESLLKGRGLLWTLPHIMPDGVSTIITSEFDSVDNLFVDPDATSLEDAKWVARKCTHHTWEVERDYKLEPGSLDGKGQLESGSSQGLSAGDDAADLERAGGHKNDLIVYYKIWSKMGCGARLSGVKGTVETEPGMKQELADAIDDDLGDYVYIVVAKGVPYPLNLPDEMLEQAPPEEVKAAMTWPIPYYADERWPFSALDYYSDTKSAWPISPMAPGLGPLKFLNVMISGLAGKIFQNQRTFPAFWKSAAKELKDAIEKGEDLTCIELEGDLGRNVNEVVQFLQAPPVNIDVWHIIDAMMEIFNKVTGLNELLYGMNPGGAQSRSATDASAKQQSVQIRPDYMARQVEQWMTETARREGMCARWFIQPQDIQMVLGPMAGQFWQMLVLDSDVTKVVRELEFRIESGTARKPNKQALIENSQQTTQMLLPLYFQYATASGDVEPFNATVAQYCKATDQPSQGMFLQPPPPPPMPQQGGPPPEQAQAAA